MGILSLFLKIVLKELMTAEAGTSVIPAGESCGSCPEQPQRRQWGSHFPQRSGEHESRDSVPKIEYGHHQRSYQQLTTYKAEAHHSCGGGSSDSCSIIDLLVESPRNEPRAICARPSRVAEVGGTPDSLIIIIIIINGT